jgi:hypothetical protein
MLARVCVAADLIVHDGDEIGIMIRFSMFSTVGGTSSKEITVSLTIGA